MYKIYTSASQLKNLHQAVFYTVLLGLLTPALTYAGIRIDNTIAIDAQLSLKVIAMAVAALFGGIASIFINTSFDEHMKHPAIAKIFIGFCLGLASALMVFEQFNLGLFSLILPTFAIASLGAPLMVFYLMWLSNPQTQAEIKEAIKQKVRDKLGANKWLN